MGQDFCSAPATSVDAEHAFSTGCRRVSFMQHGMSSQTFQACMALGSWVKTPIFPKFSEVTQIIKDAIGNDN
ncbi:hypothetical protein CVT25_014045 [Psilocybe cyanescens]|uniref:HAT C-terminal dimerisation domain-containing protein n=1 Tax=Psilocybe cyanescens TaxID=93625 RepID=A0A409XRC6_PSICY|nr:hypothetical protein CVT25_014045 [Psilocybe cyanescens]